jgi:hypothetical protein
LRRFAASMPALFALAVAAGAGAPARATIADSAPYYMCFAYTQDGLLFAGGDFNLTRARKLIAANCGLPRSVSVVLLKTIMARENGSTRTFQP